MKVDKNGLVVFNTEVNFSGGSSTFNTTTTSVQDQQLEIGVANSINITSVVSENNPHNNPANSKKQYVFSHNAVDMEVVGTTWTLDPNGWFTSEGVKNNGTIVTGSQIHHL